MYNVILTSMVNGGANNLRVTATNCGSGPLDSAKKIFAEFFKEIIKKDASAIEAIEGFDEIETSSNNIEQIVHRIHDVDVDNLFITLFYSGDEDRIDILQVVEA